MIHSGAIVAAGISQGLSTSLGIDLGVICSISRFFQINKNINVVLLFILRY